MESEEIKNLLNRIAIALERIAYFLDKGEFSHNADIKSMDEILLNETVLEKDKEENLLDVEIEDILEKFLSSRNIKIKIVPPESAADNLVNSLAEFLGSRYNSLGDLLAVIKSKMQKGETINFSIKEYTQKEISDICNFCTLLFEVAFLEQYKYFKSPTYLIKAKTSTLPAAQNFFSGKWLERFILLTIQKSVKNISSEIGKDFDFSYLLNPQIILPNGNDFELDLIFQINGKIFWIETKSGDYQEHIRKYSKMAKIMGLDIHHSILVLADIKIKKSNALTSLFNMTVYGLSQFESNLKETIKKDMESL